MPVRTPHGDQGDAEGRPRRPRRFTAAYKIGILERYDGLDRSGKTALLRAEGLRASLVSQWRAQVYAAALEALAGEPGGQPRRPIPFSDSLWAELTAAGAAASPPMSTERLVRALCACYTGREKRLPDGRIITARPAGPEGTV
jgi:hypothetical protein